eukprot:GHVS01076017.1.p1 GENE.GHVS01076017.1~~GHVS01076017.1.p1  ORF type:complete len:894 (+),score=150.62 GHVS01076017.1:71-2683(+)
MRPPPPPSSSSSSSIGPPPSISRSALDLVHISQPHDPSSLARPTSLTFSSSSSAGSSVCRYLCFDILAVHRVCFWFAISGILLVAAIVCVTSLPEPVYNYFATCHGTDVRSNIWFMTVFAVQTGLSVLRWSGGGRGGVEEAGGRRWRRSEREGVALQMSEPVDPSGWRGGDDACRIERGGNAAMIEIGKVRDKREQSVENMGSEAERNVVSEEEGNMASGEEENQQGMFEWSKEQDGKNEEKQLKSVDGAETTASSNQHKSLSQHDKTHDIITTAATDTDACVICANASITACTVTDDCPDPSLCCVITDCAVTTMSTGDGGRVSRPDVPWEIASVVSTDCGDEGCCVVVGGEGEVRGGGRRSIGGRRRKGILTAGEGRADRWADENRWRQTANCYHNIHTDNHSRSGNIYENIVVSTITTTAAATISTTLFPMATTTAVTPGLDYSPTGSVPSSHVSPTDDNLSHPFSPPRNTFSPSSVASTTFIGASYPMHAGPLKQSSLPNNLVSPPPHSGGRVFGRQRDAAAFRMASSPNMLDSDSNTDSDGSHPEAFGRPSRLNDDEEANGGLECDDDGKGLRVFVGGDAVGGEGSAGVGTLRVTGLCWNSLWMLSYYAIFFLGFHASLLGWRVYGTNGRNVQTFYTCKHMNAPVFKGQLPLIRSVISDFTFIELFLSAVSAMLFTRKYSDPYTISSYFRCLSCCRRVAAGPPMLYATQATLQTVMFVFAIWDISLCWTGGYGTPLQIMSAGLLASATLWVLSVLTHVLQVDRVSFQPTLEYHWLWATFCLIIIWLCGFLFYLSVYDLLFWSTYYIAHVATWALYALLLACRFSRIFPESQSQDTRMACTANEGVRSILLSDDERNGEAELDDTT